MGNASFPAPRRDHAEGFSPFKGACSHKAVVFPVEILHQVVCIIQGELAGGSAPEDGSHGLIIYVRRILYDPVPFPAFPSGQILYRGEEIRIVVSQPGGRFIVGVRHSLLAGGRDLAQEIIGKFAASVGCIDCGQGGHIRARFRQGYGGPGVQASLGVGYDVDLSASRFADDVQDPFFQLSGASRNGGCAVVFAVVDFGPVLFQLLRDPAPVVQVLEIPEKDSVHQKQGISGPADLVSRSLFIPFGQLLFESHFRPAGPYDHDKGKEIDQGDPAAESSDQPLFYAQLQGGRIDQNDPGPEHKEFPQGDQNDHDIKSRDPEQAPAVVVH